MSKLKGLALGRRKKAGRGERGGGREDWERKVGEEGQAGDPVSAVLSCRCRSLGKSRVEGAWEIEEEDVAQVRKDKIKIA